MPEFSRLLHPIRLVKETIGLYDELIYSHLVKDTTRDTIKRDDVENCITIDQLGYYHKDSVTFLYLIEGYPNYLRMDFKARLRKECRGDTKITFMNRIKPHKIAWNSAEMQSKLRILSQSAKEMSEKDVSAFNLHANLSDMRKQEWIQESLQYLSSADVDRARALFKTSTLVMVTGTRGEDFDESIKAILACADQFGLQLGRVLYNIPAVLAFFCPWGQQIKEGGNMSYPNFTVTDEVLARFNTYSQGTLGVGGVCFGVDVYSSFPVLKKVKSSREDAENWLISAETGGGKSYFVKALILQLLSQGYNGTIMDVEGFEYIPLANMMRSCLNVQIVNMAEGQGGYFDPVEIPIYSDASYEEAAQMRQNSIEYSLSILKVLLGQAFEEDIYLSVVVDDAVSQAYKKHGVTDNRMTWGNSKGMTLFDIYQSLKSLEGFRDDDEYNQAVRKAVSLVNKYFEPGGTRSALFKNRVAVQDIIDADLLICSFGMAGKSQSSVDEVQMALMQLGAAQLSHQRSIFSKTKGKFNFKLWEQLMFSNMRFAA